MNESNINVEISKNGDLQNEFSKDQIKENKIEEEEEEKKIEDDKIEIFKIEENMLKKEKENESNNNSDVQVSNSLNIEDQEKITKIYNIQQQNEVHNSIVGNILGDISSIKDKEESRLYLPISKISNQSFNGDSSINSFNNIINDSELQKMKNEIYEKINKGLIPFFIKLEGYCPIFIVAKNDDIFINIIREIEDQVQILDDLVKFIYNDKVIDYSYYNKTIKELEIEPLKTITIQYTNL